MISGLISRGLARRSRKPLNIRPWRRVELGALSRIYNQNLVGAVGSFQRTEAYWKWLIQRSGYDQICIALDGPDLLELEEVHAPIVGYAVTRGERIVELLTAPGYPMAASQLLVRACRDAIERSPASQRKRGNRAAGRQIRCGLVLFPIWPHSGSGTSPSGASAITTWPPPRVIARAGDRVAQEGIEGRETLPAPIGSTL